MNALCLLASSLAFAIQPTTPGPALRAQVLGLESKDSKPVLFNFTHQETRVGDGLKLVSLHTNPDGTEAMREEVTLKNEIPVFYEYWQKQLGEHGKVEIKDGKVRFSYTEPNGKVSTGEDDWSENFVVGPTMFRYVHRHWDDLAGAREFRIRIGIQERQGVYTFKVVPAPGDKPDRIRVKLVPASFFVAMFVPATYLEFDRKTRKPITSIGHAFPKKRDGDKWKDLTAETVFEP